MRISVFLKAQNPQLEQTEHETSRGFAKTLIAALAARRIGQNAIQLSTPESWRAVKLRFRNQPADPEPTVPCRYFHYIPDRMPPVDLPGVHFQEPMSATWREQHRSVSFA